MALIRNFERTDYHRVCEIYQAGIDTGFATFETQTKDWDTWDASAMKEARLVALNESNEVIGWACLSAVTNRCVYTGVAEISVYVDPKAQGKGVGGQLLGGLVLGSEEAGVWTLQARIFPENMASIALHLKLGFREVGKQERLGQLHGVWRDIVMLERRSTLVGTD
ncbi:MAG: L-amino acid N-acyltransferase YncA [Saprospiraceae bacterium]|jgi:L-amino acid N-acyltransferase YncA